MSQPPVGIAVVGAGPWGLTLANAFARLPQVQLRWICDLEDERRGRARAAHPDAGVTPELGDVLRDPGVAAVVVAVDPARHAAVSRRALDAGKHLFVEKPLALSAADAKEIHRAALARGRVLSVGHVLLHNRAVRRAREIVAAGALGEPLAFASRRATIGAPRRPGSAWWALAPHDVSLALSLFGSFPTSVTATGRAWGELQEDNAATASLHFPGGRTASIHVTRFASHRRRDVTIAGPAATLTFDELAPTDELLRLLTREGGTSVLPVERADALRAQCLDFVTRVARGDASGSAGAHAVDVVRVLEACERSMRQGGGVQALGDEVGVAVGVADPTGASLRDRTSFEAA
jgi:predicted dehydrogenase